MVYLKALGFAWEDSPTGCCIMNTHPDTRFLEPKKLHQAKMTRPEYMLWWTRSSLTEKNIALVTLKCSSELVLLLHLKRQEIILSQSWSGGCRVKFMVTWGEGFTGRRQTKESFFWLSRETSGSSFSSGAGVGLSSFKRQGHLLDKSTLRRNSDCLNRKPRRHMEPMRRL